MGSSLKAIIVVIESVIKCRSLKPNDLATLSTDGNSENDSRRKSIFRSTMYSL